VHPSVPPELAARSAEQSAPTPQRASLPDRSLIARLSEIVANSRAMVVAQHYLFEDRATYIRLYMLHGEDADYLRPPLSAAWRQRLSDFETLLAGMADRARAREVPMLLAADPQRIQAALLAGGDAAPGADPFAIERAFGEIAARHGVAFADTLKGFAKHRDPERFFYPTDGHMDAAGSAVFADTIADRLLAGDIAPFAGCDRAPQHEAQAR